MLRKRKNALILTSLLTLLPILVGLLLWNRLPDSFATHWGADGQADGWSGKAVAVFVPPLLMLAVHWLCVLITAKDPKNQNRNEKIFHAILWIVPITSNLSSALIFSLALGAEFSMSNVIVGVLGLMFLVLGNYLPKCRMNSTIGIKIPWTYSSEENWNATHRFCGPFWMIGGLAMLVSALLPGEAGVVVMLIVVVLLSIVPVLYSYWFYRKEKRAGKPMMAFLSQTDLRIMKGVLVLILLLLIGVAILLFTGKIEMHYGEDAFTIEASYYSDMTVTYDAITALEYREGNIDGTRTNGLGSFRLLLGYFRNDEFGPYIRYTYYQPEACVIVTLDTKTLVLSGADAAATQQIYAELLKHTNG